MNSQDHIVQSFDNDLRILSYKLDLMGQKIRFEFARTTRALLDQEQDIANDVIIHGSDVLRLQGELEEMALSVLALRQPVANDLRDVFFAIKIAANLNAINNDIQGICQRVISMNNAPVNELITHLQVLCHSTQAMIDQLPELIQGRNPEFAKQLFQQDDRVDQQYYLLYQAILDHMKLTKRKALSSDVHLAFIAKYIERVGDNIAIIGATIYQRTTGEMLTKNY